MLSNHLAYYQPSSLLVWECISAYGAGNLHIWKGIISAKRYIQVLEQHILASK